MKISEMFWSICGEGTEMGRPAFFVRFHGCNLRCSYCDTRYASDEPPAMEKTEEELVEIILQQTQPGDWLFFTGGEPLLQQGVGYLITNNQLNDRRIIVQTNGTIINPLVFIRADLLSIDCKGPSSGCSNYSRTAPVVVEALKRCSNDIQLKFLVKKEIAVDDLMFINSFLSAVNKDTSGFEGSLFRRIKKGEVSIIIQPVGGLETKWLIEEIMKESELYNLRDIYCNMRILFQLHKYVWGPTSRGV